jgi:uncharacterized coiled-coil DUF342 family protein
MDRERVAELSLKLAAAERMAEQAERNLEVQPWSLKARTKRDQARRRVVTLAEELAEVAGQLTLTV